MDGKRLVDSIGNVCGCVPLQESVIPGQGNKLSVQTKPSAAKEILSKKTADELLEVRRK